MLRRAAWTAACVIALLAWTGTDVARAAGPAVDALVTTHQTKAATSIASPSFSTTAGDELLVAFVTSDGPLASGAQAFATVTGGGLTWRLRRRANGQFGTTEIWQAVARTALANVTVTATRLTGSYVGSITVASFTGADTTTDGATAGASAPSGAPSASLTTTRAGSWVWGAGNDWDRATARTVGAGQTKVDEFLASVGDTFWVQRRNELTAGAATSATIDDTAPTADQWNLALIEIPPSGTAPPPDTQAPAVSLTAPADGATVSGSITVSADASDDVGVAGVQFLLDGSPLGSEDTSAPYTMSWDTTAVGNGPHTVAARARDAAGNATTSASAAVTVSNNAADPAQVGEWGPLIPLPAVAIHSALTPTGKVLLFQGDFAQGGQQYVFNPSTNAVKQVPDAAADLFCAGQAVLANGNVLVVGGTSTKGGLGVPDITAFDWRSETWSSLAPMHYPRWYATGTTLSDGKVLVTSGANQSINDIVAVPELYSPDADKWQDLTAASHTMPIYPFIYQLPDGRIAHLGGSEVPTVSEVLDLSTGQWTAVDGRVIDGGSIANYAPGKFIKAGSAADDGDSGASVKTAFTLDMNQSGATWQPTTSMRYARSFLNLTNLPDGTVLATGGGTDKSGFVDANAVLPAEDWDPSTGAWTPYAAMSAPRLYHSVALLLPDGRVYVAGGGGDPGVTDQKSAQIFSPPYLFKGPRPTISSAPDTVRYGSTAFVGTPDAGAIARVSLIRTGSVTHAFDQNARALSLSFTQTADGLDVRMPANANNVPPGYYMLFIVNGQGVPSVASFVRFPAPYEDTQAPSAPTNLTATGRIGAADLSWTAASDDVGVVRYHIHRSTTPGFAPSAANEVGQSATTSFTDTGVPVGTQYYRVTAEDAAGNVGPPSAEASATVSADETPPTAPTGLTVTAGSQSAALSWTKATDDVGVTEYRVLRDGARVGATASTSYTDMGLAPSTSYTYAVVAVDAAGNVSAPSDSVTVTTKAAPSLSLDRMVSTHQASAATRIASPPLSTSQPGELLVAFVSSDGPNRAGGQSISAVTGGGLTWTLRQRTNSQAGTAEIWQAAAPNALSDAVITATRSTGSYTGAMTVAAFIGADTSTLGAVGSASAATGAPTASLTTTRAGSWVWGVGEDWDKAQARTVGPDQTLADQFLSPSGDTFWTQRRSNVTPAAGTPVTISDTAPTSDRWDLSLIEVLAAAGV